MPKLYLSIARGQCSVAGCNSSSGVFGVCHIHERELIQGQFYQAVDRGVCSQEKPPCFSTDDEWREYVVANVLSRDKKSKVPVIDYCRDCTTQHKDSMMAAGRCIHPETVFIYSDRHQGDVIGVSMGRLSTQWESAMMGMYGPVVKLPPHETIAEMLAKIAQDKAPKKRGRRPAQKD